MPLKPGLLFLEVVQFFLQPPLSQYVFEFAPSGFALLRSSIRTGAGSAGDRVDEAIVILIFVALRHEVIIEIKVVVVSFHRDDS